MGTYIWEVGIGKEIYPQEEITMPNNIITIKWEIPYRELINKNGLKTCLKIVPGTRQYLTQERIYGKK